MALESMNCAEHTRVVEMYIKGEDWRVRENANMGFSLQGLNQYLHSQVVSHYWLENLYPRKVAQYHKEGFFHIHDLGYLSSYCVGWDLLDLLKRGFGGVNGKISSGPPKHLSTALMQVVNFMYTLQGEVAGAVAFSNFDTLLAPFVRYDGLSYKEVKQLLQEFIFNMNVPTRVGFQAPFSNLTFDLRVPSTFSDRPAIVGGQEMEESYGEFQEEMNMINLAFIEVMMEGDAANRPFSFPIPTYNITTDFDWDNEITQRILELTARYGTPYFANYLNTSMKPEDARSMCCRLRLDNRKVREHMEKLLFNFSDGSSIHKRIPRRGGLFASHPLIGSIGVVTINMPRLMYLSKGDEERLFTLLDDVLETAKESLEVKRKWVEEFTTMGLYPYSAVYLEPVKEISGKYWANHFSTIGLVGMHEALLNFGIEGGILSERGRRLALRVLKYIVEKSECFTEETGNLYNVEATPAESASYRLARLDKTEFPNILTAGTENQPYDLPPGKPTLLRVG